MSRRRRKKNPHNPLIESESHTSVAVAEPESEPEKKDWTHTIEKAGYREYYRDNHGQLEFVRKVALTKDGKPAQRKFRLKRLTLSQKKNGQQGRTSTKYNPRTNTRYKFWQKNGDWEKRDPKKEAVIPVDKMMALALESDPDFEEVFD